MANITVTSRITIGGKSLIAIQSVDDDVVIAADKTVPKAQPGILTTKTDANTGTITMTNGGHGIATSDIIDVYWDGGYISGMTAGTVSGTSVPIDLGNAENSLPVATTPVIVCKCVTDNFACTKANIKGHAIGINDTSECIVSFLNGATIEYTRHLPDGLGADFWTNLSTQASPLGAASASPTTVRLSHANVVSDRIMTVAVITH